MYISWGCETMFKRVFANRKTYEFNLSFIIIFLMLAQILTAYYFFNAQLIENFNNTKNTYIQSQIVSDNAVFYNVHSMVATLENDAAVMRMMNEEISVDELIETSLHIGRLTEYNNLISEVLVYNGNQKILYNDNCEKYETEDIKGEKLKQELLKTDGARKRILCETYVVSEQPHSGIFNNMYYISDRKSDGAIIIKIDYDNLRRQYSGWQELLKGKLMVCTKNGEVVFGGGMELGEKVENDILLPEVEGKTETVNVDGVKSVVSRYYPENSELRYITITPVKNLKFSDIAGELFVFIMISIFISVMGIILMCVQSKRFNLMLIKMKQKITEGKTSADKAGLLDYIEYYMNGVVGTGNREELIKLLPEGIEENTQIAILFVGAEYSTSMRDIAEYAADSTLRSIFKDKGYIIHSLQKSGTGVQYIVKTNDGDSLTKICEICAAKIKEQTGIKTFFSQSDCVTATEIIECYKQAAEVEKYRYIYGNDKVLTPEVIKEKDHLKFEEIKNICANIRINTKNTGECEAMTEELFKRFRKMNINEVYDGLWELVVAVHDMIRSINNACNMDIMFNAVDGLKAIETSSTIEEVREYVKNMIAEIEGKLNSMQTNKVNILIEKCKSIIEANYTDSGICLELIADEVGVTANYLGRKFKQITGISIADTITGMRMKKAERLIAETDENMKCIAEQVGFVDSNYFSVMFRKYYGVPPTVYRRNVKN